jgi:hypothetical protein
MEGPEMQVQSTRDNGRGTIVAGFVLLLIGGAALVSQLWPEFDQYIPLMIGLGLLAVFVFTRAYLALVFGSILSGLGVGLLVAQTAADGSAEGAGVVLGLGIGFISIWVVSGLLSLREHHFWPLLPGGILLAVGLGLTFDLLEGDLSRYFIPALIALFGLVIMVVGWFRISRTGSGHSA